MTPRYGPDYRKDELSKICQYAQRGDSLAFVGVAGTGKSNITNFLCKDPYDYKPQYLEDKIDTVHFVLVDGTTWDGTVQSLVAIMLDALESVADGLPATFEPPTTIPLAPEGERAKRNLNQLVDWFCQKLNHRLQFILDDFDTVISRGPLSLLEELSRLRNNHRGKLSYLMFTKVLPHVLGREYDLENKSKFYDLFKGHVFSLGMYSYDDSRQMLNHLNHNSGNQLARSDLFEIQSLTGGHARLMRLLFDSWLDEAPPTSQELHYFAAHPVSKQECQRILAGLYSHEREVIVRAAQNRLENDDYIFVDYLKVRGLIIDTEPIIWFSPLMAQYLHSLG